MRRRRRRCVVRRRCARVRKRKRARARATKRRGATPLLPGAPPQRCPRHHAALRRAGQWGSRGSGVGATLRAQQRRWVAVSGRRPPVHAQAKRPTTVTLSRSADTPTGPAADPPPPPPLPAVRPARRRRHDARPRAHACMGRMQGYGPGRGDTPPVARGPGMAEASRRRRDEPRREDGGGRRHGHACAVGRGRHRTAQAAPSIP